MKSRIFVSIYNEIYSEVVLFFTQQPTKIIFSIILRIQQLMNLSFVNAMAVWNDMFIDFSIDLNLIMLEYMRKGLNID